MLHTVMRMIWSLKYGKGIMGKVAQLEVSDKPKRFNGLISVMAISMKYFVYNMSTIPIAAEPSYFYITNILHCCV